jgi:cation diffusion facilitator family transporter
VTDSAHDHDHDDDHGHDHGARGSRLTRLRELLFGHSHDTAEKLDAALEGSAEGLRAVRWSLVGLGITAILQGVVVIATGSVALLSDTLHNVADALTAVPLGIAFVLGRRPPTRRFNYGYGRAEDLAGAVVVLAIAASAAFAGYESIRRLLDPREVEYVVAVAAAGVVGFVGNEAVARYRIRVGRRIGSAALVADGLHARTDGFTSLAVVLGAIGVALGWNAADPVVGLLITVAILTVLRTAAREVLHRLMDAVDPDLVERAERVLGAVAGVEHVGEVRLRWIGHALRAEARVVVDMTQSVADGHAIAESARHTLLHEIPRLRDAIVHVDPCGHDGMDPHHDAAHHPADPLAD